MCSIVFKLSVKNTVLYRLVFMVASVCLGGNLKYDGSGRLHVPEKRYDAGAVAGGDQLSEDQGNETVVERW